jgi:hypothetical protein
VAACHHCALDFDQSLVVGVGASGGVQKVFGEAGLGLVETAAHGSDRDVQHRRDLLVGRVAGEVAEHQRDGLVFGKAVDRGPHPVRDGELLDRLFDVKCAGRARIGVGGR